MRKLYLVSIRRGRITYSLSAVLILVTCVAILYASGFSGINAAKEVSLDRFGLADSGSNISGGKLAIIIDDFGQSRAGVKEMMSIDQHLTFAVMPFLEYSQIDAETAHEKAYEVIVHLPMEPNHGKPSWLGPRPILAGMKNDDVKQIVRDAFDNVPYAVGANVHMGSKASSEETTVSSILDVIKEKNLYFVDSRTADHPICKKLADAKDVLCYDRDIFIDEGRSKTAIKKQLQKAGEIALKKGKAVAIGHVGAEGGKATADAISEMLPEFDRNNISLVFVSELQN